MAKLALDPRKSLAIAPVSVRVAYFAALASGLLIFADGLSRGRLLGIFSSSWAIVVSLIVGYLFADNGLLFLKARLLGRHVALVLQGLLVAAGVSAFSQGTAANLAAAILSGVLFLIVIGSLYSTSARAYFASRSYQPIVNGAVSRRKK